MSIGTPKNHTVNLPHQKWCTEKRTGKQKTKTLLSALFHFQEKQGIAKTGGKHQIKESASSPGQSP